jgi:hypothetical protein
LTELAVVAPSTCDYSAKAAAVLADIYSNDNLGDCVIAAGYHIVGVETGNAGTAYRATSAQIVHDYSAIGGYVPGDPNTDQGCELPTALSYWQSHGFTDGTKLLGSIAVDATNLHEVQLACYLFENLFFGIDLPDAWIAPFPSDNGFVWDIAGGIDPQNGHCIMGMGYDTRGVKIDTWGMLGTLTWAAVAKYATATAGGELHVMLSPDQLAKGQTKAPNGIAWADLISDFDALGGQVPVPAPPVPVPPAPPPPSPNPPPAAKALTLAQVEKLLQTSWPK